MRKLDRTEIHKMLVEGLTDTEIGEKMGSTASTIYSIRVKEFRLLYGRQAHYDDKRKLIAYLLGFYNKGRKPEFKFLNEITLKNFTKYISDHSELYADGINDRIKEDWNK